MLSCDFIRVVLNPGKLRKSITFMTKAQDPLSSTLFPQSCTCIQYIILYYIILYYLDILLIARLSQNTVPIIMANQVMVPFLVAMMLLTGVCNTLLSKYQVEYPHYLLISLHDD